MDVTVASSTRQPRRSVTSGRRPLSQRGRETLAGYLFVAPSVIGMFVFLVLPMIASLTISFFRVSGSGTTSSSAWTTTGHCCPTRSSPPR